MPRKSNLTNNVQGRRERIRRNHKITNVSELSEIALALQEQNYEIINKISKDIYRNTEKLSKLSQLSGLTVDDILKSISKTQSGNILFDASEIDSDKEVSVLYDVSGSMWYATNHWSQREGSLYIPFHHKMLKIFRKLESEGVKVRIYFFSNDSISCRPPITVDEFESNERIPGGGTILAPAWNQLVNNNGSVLLVTDGKFTDNISEFNLLKSTNTLSLAVPTWTNVSTDVIQNLRNHLGTIPLNHIPSCDTTFSVEEFADTIKRGSNVVELPIGYMRYGDIVFPECWKKPSVIGMIINHIIEYKSEDIPHIFSKFKSIFTQIYCSMNIDFEGCLKSEDSRNLLQLVNFFMKISLSQINKIELECPVDSLEPEPEDEQSSGNHTNFDFFLEMNDICKKIFDYGSNQKDIYYNKYNSSGLTEEAERINNYWDSCFSIDETQDIVMSHTSDRQTGTIVFNTYMPYEIIRQLRSSSHALDRDTMVCLILYFSKENFEIRDGIYTGYGTIPIWNNNLIDSIRLIPSHTIFPDGDGLSFTFSVTVAYRILMWIVSEMFGPNRNIFP